MKVTQITVGLKQTHNIPNYRSVASEVSITVELDEDDNVTETVELIENVVRTEVYSQINQTLEDYDLEPAFDLEEQT